MRSQVSGQALHHDRIQLACRLVTISCTSDGLCLSHESASMPVPGLHSCCGPCWLSQATGSLLRAGVKTHFGLTFRCRAAVLTTGTFMNGRIWVGRASMPAGR